MIKRYLYEVLFKLHLISEKRYNKCMAKHLSGYMVIAKSKYFDKKWYLNQNPELKETGADPVKHYLNEGWKKHKNPSPLFNGDKYLELFPDVKNAGVNPLFHYEAFAKKEGRDCSKLGIQQQSRVEKFFIKLLRKAANCPNQKRNIVIMNDMIFDFRAEPLDNFAFFEYAAERQNELKFYYILNTKNSRYAEIKKKYGKYILGYRNKYDIIFKIKMVMLTYHTRYMLDSFDALSKIFYDVFYSSPYITTIFTQHGITFFKQDYIKGDVYGQKKLNKTTVSNDLEYEIFRKKGKYRKSNIIKLGLFRWDKVHDTSAEKETKSVFVYFTYRHYLHGVKDIMKTKYFKNIFALLQNKKISKLFEKNNIEFKIALHHDLLLYVKKKQFKNIKFVAEEDILNVKNEAKMLITDYSSMCFEFMLQNKPVIFWRFDREEFKKSLADSQYSKNIDDLDQYIYNVVEEEDDVVKLLRHYVRTGFSLEKNNSKKAELFFYNKENIREKFYKYLLDNLHKKKEK